MKFLLILAILMGCSSSSKYKAGECFQPDPFTIVEITKVDSKYYYVYVHSLFSGEKKYTKENFESQIEKDGLIVKSCEEFNKK